MGGLYSIPLLNAVKQTSTGTNGNSGVGLESLGDRFDYLKQMRQEMAAKTKTQ